MHPDAQPIHRLPRAVVFDLGKVLLEFDYRIAARALAADSDLDADAILEILDQSPCSTATNAEHWIPGPLNGRSGNAPVIAERRKRLDGRLPTSSPRWPQ